MPWFKFILFLPLLNMAGEKQQHWLASCPICDHRPEAHLSCCQAITLYSPAHSLPRFLRSQFNILSSLLEPLILSSWLHCQMMTWVLPASPRKRELHKTSWALSQAHLNTHAGTLARFALPSSLQPRRTVKRGSQSRPGFPLGTPILLPHLSTTPQFFFFLFQHSFPLSYWVSLATMKTK